MLKAGDVGVAGVAGKFPTVKETRLFRHRGFVRWAGDEPQMLSMNAAFAPQRVDLLQCFDAFVATAYCLGLPRSSKTKACRMVGLG